MPALELYPLRFEPILRELIWGGRRLGTLLHKPIGPASDYAESWELSDYRDQVSRVADGPLAGASLRDLIQSHPSEILGPAIGPLDQFPLLIKFIDANQDLSVQVHPDDAKGLLLANDNGKTETWVIMAAEPGSQIYAGLKPGVGPSEFQRALASGAVEPLLHRFEARPGDAILIEAGTVHAIGAGVLLAEIQQMSDATFRVFDWNRVGADGNPRDLHIDEASESIDFDRGPVDPLTPEIEDLGASGTRERLGRSSYFACDRWRLKGPAHVGQPDRFTILMALEGRCSIRSGNQDYAMEYGQTMLLPAALGACEMVPDGAAVVLSCIVP